jgi:sulfur carrier protein
MAGKINITVNGLPEQIPEGSTVAEVIEMLGEADMELITEMNGRFIRVSEYSRITVSEGDILEFIYPAFGG